MEKFEALRDGKFEMKDMVPCSGLEPLQSASMVASWPRRCAALRAVCLVETHAPLVHEPSEKSGNVFCFDLSEGEGLARGNTKNQKSMLCFGRIFV